MPVRSCGGRAAGRERAPSTMLDEHFLADFLHPMRQRAVGQCDAGQGARPLAEAMPAATPRPIMRLAKRAPRRRRNTHFASQCYS